MSIDSIIFDLDGTLWDSSEGVSKTWSLVLNKYDYERKEVTVEDLHICMGKQLDEIGEILFPNLSSEVRKNLMHECCTLENEYLGEHGGKLYLKVEETLKELSKKYKLFIVSNCQDGYIECFFKAHKLDKYFTDYECPGRTGLSKGENNKLIIAPAGVIYDWQATIEVKAVTKYIPATEKTISIVIKHKAYSSISNQASVNFDTPNTISIPLSFIPVDANVPIESIRATLENISAIYQVGLSGNNSQLNGGGLVKEGIRWESRSPRPAVRPIDDINEYFGSYIKYAVENNVKINKDINTELVMKAMSGKLDEAIKNNADMCIMYKMSWQNA